MPGEKEKKELVAKVTQLIDREYGGDWDRAFDTYAQGTGSGSLLERDDLLEVLADADVGNWMTRGAWADGVVKELDSSGDAKISRSEFRLALKSDAASPLR